MELGEEIRNISDLVTLVNKFRTYNASYTEWVLLNKSLDHGISIIKILHKYSIPFFPESVNMEKLSDLNRTIKGCLDLTMKGKISVKRGIDESLDYLLTTDEDIERQIYRMVTAERNELERRGISSFQINIVYFPQLGYFIEVNHPEEGYNSDGSAVDENIPGYDLQFKTDQGCYYKCATTSELDSRYGDIQNQINTRQAAIIQQIQEMVLQSRDCLSQLSNGIGQLDAYLALVTFAQNYNLCCPEMTETFQTCEISQGRHILSEQVIEHFIPNDCKLGNGHTCAIIAGPNYSGKSVYLKQIALIVYMAHIGSYVPAEAARISLVDKIFARIFTEDNLSTSSFTQELIQIEKAMSYCTEKSLILVDEFGKGTCVFDGMALLCSMIDRLTTVVKPMLLITTHYKEIITHELVPESDIVRYYTMEIRDADEPVLLYRLINQKPQSSLGMTIARWAGMEDTVVTRAEEVQKWKQGGTKLQPIATQGSIDCATNLLKLVAQLNVSTVTNESFQESLTNLV